MEDAQSSNAENSVTVWIEQLKDGNSAAGQKLWGRYVQLLARLACKKMGSYGRAVMDEDDVALSVFHALLRGTEQGRFPQLDDRNDLWQVLSMLTARKAIDAKRLLGAKKRGEGNVFNAVELSFVVGTDPTPQMAAESKELIEQLLNNLPSDKERHIAIGKLEGKTIAELSAEMGISRRSIDRKLHLIRRRWSEILEIE